MVNKNKSSPLTEQNEKDHTFENFQSQDSISEKTVDLGADLLIGDEDDILRAEIKDNGVYSEKDLNLDINQELETVSEKLESSFDIGFAAESFIGSVMFRQNLDELSAGQDEFLEKVSQMDSDTIEETYGTFADRMINIREEISNILRDDDFTIESALNPENILNPEDKRYAIETMALIDVALNNLNNDNTQNINIIEQFNQYTKKINNRLKDHDEEKDLTEEADKECERRKKLEDISNLSDNEIDIESNWRLQKSQQYLDLANQLASRNVNYGLELYRAKRDADPEALLSSIKINPHIFGQDVTAQNLVKNQVKINKENLSQTTLLNRSLHSIKREFQASHVMWRDHVMKNPLAIPIKGLLIAYDSSDKLRHTASHRLQVNGAKAISNMLHESGMKAGEAAVLKQIKELRKDEVSAEEALIIQRRVQNSFNGLQNQSIIAVKSIVDDARNGVLSPIIANQLNKFKPAQKAKDELVDDEPTFNNTKRRTMRMA